MKFRSMLRMWVALTGGSVPASRNQTEYQGIKYQSINANNHTRPV